MLTDLPEDGLLVQFFDALPDAAIYFRAIRDEQGELVDLLVAQGNEKGGLLVAQSVFGVGFGEPMLGDNPERIRLLQPIFRQYAALLLNGETQQFDYLHPELHRLVHVTRSKLDDGVLVVLHDPADYAKPYPTRQDLAGQLSGILEASLNGIITYESIRDRDGALLDFRFVRLNQAAMHMLALTNDVVGKPMLEHLPGVRESGLFDRIVRVVETGVSERFETPYPAGNERLWYEMSVVKLGDGFVITFNDITQTKQTLLQLDQQRSLLNEVVNGVQIGLVLLEPVRNESGDIVDLRYTLTNERVTQILGLPLKDTIGRTLLEVYPGAGTFELPGAPGETLLNRYIRQIREGGTSGYEFVYNRDGRTVWFQTSGNALVDREGIVISFADITSIKESQRALEQAALENERQAAFVNNVLDSSSNGIVAQQAVRDENGTIVDFLIVSANRQAAQLVKTTVEGMVGKRELALHPGLRASGLFDAYVKTVETGEPQFVETYYHDDRLAYWLQVKTRKLGDGQVVTFTDVSENKWLQQALEQTAAEARQQAQLVQTMLDGAINGVLLLEPQRNERGDLIDFRIRGSNPAVQVMTGVDPAAIIGQLMSEAYPGYKENGFFALYGRALETDEHQRAEFYYQDGRLEGWFDVSAVRQRFDGADDGIVLTFTNTTAARQAQQVAEESRTNLQAVIDYSQTGIFVVTPLYDDADEIIDFRFKTVNRTVAALVGQTPDALIGAVVSDWFVSYRETGLFNRYKRTADTGDEQRFDINYNVDGLDLWFDVHAVRFGPDLLVTYTDFTALKRTQLAAEQQAAETRRQADLLNSVLNSSINGIMSFESLRNASGQIIDFVFRSANEATGRLLGQSTSGLIGQRLLNVFPGNKETGLLDMYIRTAETGEPTHTEMEYRHDGLDLWLDISAQKLGDGFVVTFSDVSIVKRATQAVEQSAAELQTVIDTSQTGIFLFSPIRDETGEVVDFRFRVANRQLASYVGQRPEMVVGALGSTWFPGYKTNGLFENYKHTYLTGEQLRFDFHYDTDDIDVWLDIMSTKMGDEVLVTFGDYTPLKHLQHQLQASVIELQRSNRNLEQFAYVASHDLQEPLRKIQAFGDILHAQYTPLLGEEGADMLRRMQSAAGRMQVLIKDVLTYSRIATRREAIREVNLNQLVNDVLSDLETAIADKQALVHLDALPTLTGDAAQLRQLFQNLISNSLKFTRPDLQPELRLTGRIVRGRDAPVPVSIDDENRLFHQIELADNGIGFDPKQADRIFQVFQRLHGRSEYQGTGIGLAIVQKVVENHQGYIRADGRPGDGAVFTVLLPV